MTDPKQNQKRKAWLNWARLFVPLCIVSLFAIQYFGFARVLPILLTLLGGVLLFQRYVRKRTWHAILWGEQT